MDTNTHRHIAKWFDLTLIVLFVTIIAGPLVAMLAGRSSQADLAENRRLAMLPAWEWRKEAIRAYPEAFTEWFGDHFAFRPEMITCHNWAKFKLLRVYRSQKALIGQDGWLFYTSDGILRDHLGLRRFSDKQLAQWACVIRGRRDWLARQGIGYVFVIAPNKMTIYGQFLPEHLRRVARSTQLDQLMAHLQNEPDLRILDLRQPMRQAAESHQVYFRQDTHWNQRGAIAAYQELTRALGDWTGGAEPWELSDFRSEMIRRDEGDLAAMLGGVEAGEDTEDFRPIRPEMATPAAWTEPPGADWPEHWARQPVALQTPDGSGTLVVFHDSFFDTPHVRRLAEHFARSVFLQTTISHARLEAIVRQERPTVIVEQWVERSLRKLPADEPEFAAPREQASRTGADAASADGRSPNRTPSSNRYR